MNVLQAYVSSFALIPSVPNLRQGDRGAKATRLLLLVSVALGAGEPHRHRAVAKLAQLLLRHGLVHRYPNCSTGPQMWPLQSWVTCHSAEGWREWIPSNTKTFRKNLSKHYRLLLESNKNTECEWKKIRGSTKTFMLTYKEPCINMK